MAAVRSLLHGVGGAVAGGGGLLAIVWIVGWPDLTLSGGTVTLFVALLPLVFLLLIAVHEGGHLLAGALAGFNPSLLIVGPVRLERTGAGWRAAVNRSFPVYGGLAGATPRGTQQLRQRMTALVAGGPAASLAAGAAAIWLLAARPPHDNQLIGVGAIAFLLVLTFGLGSLFVGLTALVPGHGHGFSSDGARLLRFLHRGPGVDGEVALLGLIGASMAGARPRDWSPDLIALALQLPADSAYGAAARMMAHGQALDRGDFEEARRFLQTAVEHRTRLPAISQPALAVQAAYFEAVHGGNAGLARLWLKEAQADAVVSPHARPLAEAAVRLAEGDSGAAEPLARAERELPHAIDRGGARMAADQIADLQRALEALRDRGSDDIRLDPR
jgi:hypothetical protein